MKIQYIDNNIIYIGNDNTSIKTNWEDFREEITASSQIEIEYCLITNFSRLPPKIKLQARILRRKLFIIPYLSKISQREIRGNVILEYSQDNTQGNIDFTMQENVTSTQLFTWQVESVAIRPDESLAPWYYQKELITYRKKKLKNSPHKVFFSDYITHVHSNDIWDEKCLDEIFENEEFISFGDLENLLSGRNDLYVSEFIKYMQFTRMQDAKIHIDATKSQQNNCDKNSKIREERRNN